LHALCAAGEHVETLCREVELCEELAGGDREIAVALRGEGLVLVDGEETETRFTHTSEAEDDEAIGSIFGVRADEGGEHRVLHFTEDRADRSHGSIVSCSAGVKDVESTVLANGRDGATITSPSNRDDITASSDGSGEGEDTAAGNSGGGNSRSSEFREVDVCDDDGILATDRDNAAGRRMPSNGAGSGQFTDRDSRCGHISRDNTVFRELEDVEGIVAANGSDDVVSVGTECKVSDIATTMRVDQVGIIRASVLRVVCRDSKDSATHGVRNRDVSGRGSHTM